MHTISLKGLNGSANMENKELIMIQYMIKLLTILSNIVITHLQLLKPYLASIFVVKLSEAVLQPSAADLGGPLTELESFIMKCDEKSTPD